MTDTAVLRIIADLMIGRVVRTNVVCQDRDCMGGGNISIPPVAGVLGCVV